MTVLLAAATSGCIDDPPRAEQLELGAPGCEGTKPGMACLTLAFSATSSVRADAPGDLTGSLSWGLYRGGDVSVFGPGDHERVAGGTIDGADLSAEGQEPTATLADLEARDYQALAFLDDDGSGGRDATSGDVVTFPDGPFDVPPDAHTVVHVQLDYVR